MTHKFTILSAAVALALGASVAHAADFDDMVSVRGFGTFGVMHSSEDQADVRDNPFVPDGTGYTRDFDMRNLTRLAGQVNVRFTEQLSFTVQALSQYQSDKSFKPQIEWANLKYSFTPDFSVRVGRTALPTFLLSDSRLVGYAQTNVRPPEEVYQTSSITSNDGVDVSYSFMSGSLKNSFQAFYGVSEADLPGGKVEAEPTYGVNYLAEVGDASFRVSYILMDLTLESAQLDQIFAGLRTFGGALNAFGFTAAGGQALGFAEKYKLDDMNLSYLSLGGSYDPGTWFVMGEGMDFGGDGFLSDVRAGYVTAGARVSKFTPYVTVSKVKAFIPNEPGISTAGLPAMFAAGAAGLNAGMNMTLNQFRGSQQTGSLGLRWDAMTNIAIKAQYDHVDLGDNSAGLLANPQPGFEPGSSHSVVSLTVDFIF